MRNRWVLFATAAVLALPSSSAWGWSKPGHMIVAEIAYSRLTSKAKAKIKPLIASTLPTGSKLTQEQAFLEAAHWADDIAFRDKKYKPAHYIDLPFSDDGKDRTYAQPPEDVVKALGECVTTLKDPKATTAAKTDMLRYLIHFAGDVHQPMHAVSRFTTAMPNGDRGGNEFKIPGANENLHHLWDMAVGGLKELHNPVNAQDYAYIRADAKTLCTEYPKVDFAEESLTDFATWAQESHSLAVETAYVGVTQGVKPSEDYVTHNQPEALKRITLAGYRLADLLNRVFK